MQTEQKTAHTPGPWKPVYNDDGTEYNLAIVKDDEVMPEIAIIRTEFVSHDQAEADAALIAAAPDLLEALREVVHAWEDDSATDLEIRMEAMMECVYAAIARARGEA